MSMHKKTTVLVRHRVKFRDHYFADEERKNGKIMITAGYEYLRKLYSERYGIRWVSNPVLGGCEAWVPLDEIVEMKDVKERVCFWEGDVYEVVDENEKQYLLRIDIREAVEPFIEKEGKEPDYYIISESEKAFLIRLKSDLNYARSILKERYEIENKNPWKKKGEWYYKWIPKEEVYFYK